MNKIKLEVEKVIFTKMMRRNSYWVDSLPGDQSVGNILKRVITVEDITIDETSYVTERESNQEIFYNPTFEGLLRIEKICRRGKQVKEEIIFYVLSKMYVFSLGVFTMYLHET